ncbi:GntR family transcriptional regulator [Rhodoferax koreense]|uniref:GntR family transcriptional regulator n=1 Tax=Rhodoferax koreensis TaxID=1842727 RepID=A0A1P8K2D9_9BURK|nr:GntR family transcriptional regulator [Rhodoferax koreense]APW40178.1 GntR family transcriptional regulator [Rhodoferax koreense]
MASQIERVINELRRRVLAGQLAPGERLVEVQYSAELGVSRTPLRIALGELEKEGLLERLPKRGFQVRRFSIDAIAQAVDVRGVLEGMAARSVAEAGANAHTLQTLETCVREGELVLQEAAAGAGIDAMRWVAMNALFHRTLVVAADNAALATALEAVSRTPMAGAGALGLNGSLPRLEYKLLLRAQHDHADVLHAIVAREGSRAEAIMREHARRSRDNKREMMLRLQQEGGQGPAADDTPNAASDGVPATAG